MTKPGYADLRRIFNNNPAPSFIEARSQRADAGFFGRVVNETGDPIRRFSAYLKDLAAPNMSGFLRLFDTEDGRFSVTDVAPGDYSLLVVPEGGSLDKAKVAQVEVRKGFYLGKLRLYYIPLARQKNRNPVAQ